MKILSLITKTLCAGTISSLACQAAVLAYADEVPSTFVEGKHSPEVASYVQSIAGVALASGFMIMTRTQPTAIKCLPRCSTAAMSPTCRTT